ncbi:MAG TPA: hypothetical protein VF988_06945 [Verrucomicrobiae bacterium]
MYKREMAIRWSQLRRRLAECNSAIQQIKNLRYEGGAASSRDITVKYAG